MCDFQWGVIECRGGGYCWDADEDGYDPNDLSYPCPRCNTKQWLLDRKDEAESTSYYKGPYDQGTGETIWTSAVEVAERENPEGTPELLLEIGCVETLDNDDVVVYTYTEGSVEVEVFPFDGYVFREENSNG